MTKNQKLILGACLIVLAIATTTVAVSWYWSRRTRVIQSPHNISPPTSDSGSSVTGDLVGALPGEISKLLASKNTSWAGEVYFPGGNFSLLVPAGWQVIPSSDLTRVPDGVTSIAESAFLKRGTTCTLIYGGRPQDGARYRQTSIAPTIIAEDKERLGSEWSVEEAGLPTGFVFSGTQRYPLNGEVRTVIYPLHSDSLNSAYGALSLYNQDSSPVSEDCSNEFSAIVGSVRRQYKWINLSKSSGGVLSMEWGTVENGANLLFRRDGDTVNQRVIIFHPQLNLHPIVYRDRLYFIERGQIKVLDIFSKQINRLADLLVPQGEVVNDFYVWNDKVFYLVGPDCHNYKARCNLRLWQYDLETGQAQQLSVGVTSREILSYDQNENSLYLVYYEGDAGCWVTDFEKYDFNSKQLKLLPRLSACEAEMENGSASPVRSQAWQQRESLIERFKNQAVLVDMVRIEGGELYPASTTPGGGVWQLRYTH